MHIPPGCNLATPHRAIHPTLKDSPRSCGSQPGATPTSQPFFASYLEAKCPRGIPEWNAPVEWPRKCPHVEALLREEKPFFAHHSSR